MISLKNGGQKMGDTIPIQKMGDTIPIKKMGATIPIC